MINIQINDSKKEIFVGFEMIIRKNSFHFCMYSSFNVINTYKTVYKTTTISNTDRTLKQKQTKIRLSYAYANIKFNIT
jgi:hypothetical protein